MCNEGVRKQCSKKAGGDLPKVRKDAPWGNARYDNTIATNIFRPIVKVNNDIFYYFLLKLRLILYMALITCLWVFVSVQTEALPNILDSPRRRCAVVCAAPLLCRRRNPAVLLNFFLLVLVLLPLIKICWVGASSPYVRCWLLWWLLMLLALLRRLLWNSSPQF